MWKKMENEYTPSEGPISAVPAAEPSRDRLAVGASIIIKGDVSGEEDLVVQGRVEGKIELKQHNVTIGKSGRVKADIWGKVISVEGEVTGNLIADDKVIIRQSGAVRGNITAPRVTLEEGSKFKGSIDMDAKGQERQKSLMETSAEKAAAAEMPRKIALDPGAPKA